MHKPFQGVDTAKADIELVGAELVNGPAESVSDLALLGNLQLLEVGRLLRAVGVVGNDESRTEHQYRHDADPGRNRFLPAGGPWPSTVSLLRVHFLPPGLTTH